MIPKHRLSDVSAQDLLNLITAGHPEGKTIEYKSELPGPSTKDKQNFLADVTAFANTLGGDVVYGMEERLADGRKTGIPQSLHGVEVGSRDEVQLRLDAIIRSGIDPKIPGGVGMHWIPHPSEKRPTLVMRIPQSLAGPHMVIGDDVRRFYGRGSAGNFRMDVRELRAAFEMSGDIAKRLRSFRAERLMQIASGTATVELQAPSRGRLVLHIVPISAFGLGAQIDLSSPPRLELLSTSSEYTRFNLDGHFSYREKVGYVQLFRSGALEAVDCCLADTGASGRAGGLPSVLIENALIKGSRDYSAALDRLGARAPYFLAVTLVGVNGVKWLVRQRTAQEEFSGPPHFERDTVEIPEIEVEPGGETMWFTRLRPAIDMLWQAAGRARSPNYDASGLWSPRDGGTW